MHADSFPSWLRAHAPLLVAGHELLLPLMLPHPRSIGFVAAALPPFGQANDWVYAVHEGRLVVHEMAHGQCIIRLERAPSAIGAALERGAALLARALVELGGALLAQRR